MEYKTYIVKPVYKESKRGLHLQQLKKIRKDTGEVMESMPLKRTKGIDSKGNSLVEPIKAEKNSEGTLYDLGLSEMIENPFKERDVKELLNQYQLDKSEWKEYLSEIVKEESISKQRWAEIRFGLPFDELTQRVPPKRSKDNPDPRTRIMKKNVILYDTTNVFSEDNLEGWLSIQILKNASHRVTDDPERINSAEHGWIILEQSREETLSIDASVKHNLAIAKLAKFSTEYPFTMALEENVLYFISSLLLDDKFKPLIKGKVSPAVVSKKINEYLKVNNKKELMRNVDKFEKVTELFEKTPELFYAKYLAQSAKNVQSLQQSNGIWYWVSQRDKTDNMGSYQFNSQDAFATFIYNEIIKMDSPVFMELLIELKRKNVVIPSVFNVID